MKEKSEVTLSIENEKRKKGTQKQNKKNQTQLIFMLLLTFGYFFVEFSFGYLTHSLALISDSFHMLSDVFSLIIAFVAVRISPKKWSQNTFGWARAEVLGALVNAVFLIALCLTIIVDALERFLDPKPIENPKLVLIVGSVGLLVNLIGLGLFHEHGHSHGGHGHSHGGGSTHSHGHGQTKMSKQHETIGGGGVEKSVNLVHWSVLPPVDTSIVSSSSENEVETIKPRIASGQQMNMHGVFLHVFADALGSVIVIVAALIIWLTTWEWKDYVDPVLSILMVIVIIISTCPLLISSAKVLLQTVPTHIQIDELRQKLLSKVEEVEDIHEFHIWQLSGNKIIVSAHILCSNQADFMKVGSEVKEFFHNEGIHSTTIQLEFAEGSSSGSGNSESLEINEEENDSKSDCFLTCPLNEENEDCVSNSCCGIQKKKISPAAHAVWENQCNTEAELEARNNLNITSSAGISGDHHDPGHQRAPAATTIAHIHNSEEHHCHEH